MYRVGNKGFPAFRKGYKTGRNGDAKKRGGIFYVLLLWQFDFILERVNTKSPVRGEMSVESA